MYSEVMSKLDDGIMYRETSEASTPSPSWNVIYVEYALYTMLCASYLYVVAAYELAALFVSAVANI